VNLDSYYVQSIRYKLQKRISRLNSVDTLESFGFTLAQFWRFFDQHSTLCGVAISLIAQFPEIDKEVDKIFKERNGLYGETEEEHAAISYRALRRLTENLEQQTFHAVARAYKRSGKNFEVLECVREVFLEPFYEYVDEQLDDQRAMHTLLVRYKHRSEWFHRDLLWELSKTPKKAEKLLALNLYSYLYDQGIDFSIEPSSISGAIDLIAAQNKEDPLLLDAKVFDGEGRGKNYICKGFNQIYTYTQQYNEPFGYLLIFKTTERDLRFSLKLSGNIPMLIHNHKTIFLITIDIYKHEKPVSKRGPIKAINITEEELIEIVEENKTESNKRKETK